MPGGQKTMGFTCAQGQAWEVACVFSLVVTSSMEASVLALGSLPIAHCPLTRKVQLSHRCLVCLLVH